ncbi:MAG TPA: redoxin domain-containing protein, partial [Nevskiaceae bacterium]|nr:redoxin domain-containing protein [Nevskiaceae bacterium]
MKLIRALALLVVSTVALADVKPGDAAPAFSLPGSDGRTHALADYAGKFVVLEWTNDGCPFVHKHYDSGNMQSLQKDATARGVVWLSMVSSAPGKEGHVTAQQAAQLTRERHAAPTAVL